jgi:hypothetical protein
MKTTIIIFNTENENKCFYLQSIREIVYHVVGRHPKPSVSHPTKQDHDIMNDTRASRYGTRRK